MDLHATEGRRVTKLEIKPLLARKMEGAYAIVLVLSDLGILFIVANAEGDDATFRHPHWHRTRVESINQSDADLCCTCITAKSSPRCQHRK